MNIFESLNFALTLPHTHCSINILRNYSNIQTFRIIDYLISFNRAQEMNVQVREKNPNINRSHFNPFPIHSHAEISRILRTLHCCYCHYALLLCIFFSLLFNIKMCCISICASNRRSQNNSCHLLCSYKILKNHTKPNRKKNVSKQRERKKGWYGLVFAYAVAQNPQQ